MNFLRLVVIGMILVSALNRETRGGGFDLERIVTVHGREYRAIQILEADGHGLTFRHSEGIAKLGFSSLSENLRMLYETVTDFGEEGGPGAETLPNGGGDVEMQDEFPFLVVTVRNRVTFAPPALWLGGGISPGSQLMGPSNWPFWWHRYSPVHELTNPYYRELAVRDFLYTSGLLARPPGIVPYPVPCRRHSVFY